MEEQVVRVVMAYAKPLANMHPPIKLRFKSELPPRMHEFNNRALIVTGAIATRDDGDDCWNVEIDFEPLEERWIELHNEDLVASDLANPEWDRIVAQLEGGSLKVGDTVTVEGESYRIVDQLPDCWYLVNERQRVYALFKSDCQIASKLDEATQ